MKTARRKAYCLPRGNKLQMLGNRSVLPPPRGKRFSAFEMHPRRFEDLARCGQSSPSARASSGRSEGTSKFRGRGETLGSRELKKVTGSSATAKVQAALGSSREDGSRLSRHLAHAAGAGGKDHNVQLRRKCRNKAAVPLIFSYNASARTCCAPKVAENFTALHQVAATSV